MFSHITRKRVGRWWAARSSKPVGGMRNLPGGFDSHALPPSIYRDLDMFVFKSLTYCSKC